jgi:L-seryl-tRNA(Ser) seleniumtransferase
MTPRSPDLLRAIPPVDELLSQPAFCAWRSEYPGFPWTRFVRGLIDALREGGDAGAPAAERGAVTAWLVHEAGRRLEVLREGGLKPVLNGTGVILHTNLGRAPLGDHPARAADRALRGYVSLEVDLASGERSRRGDVVERLFALLCGAEAAMIVNNNAAAVYLVANSFSPPGRIIVSRGELVEIGGSFRLPEILRHAAAEVIEVGTTNRTYAADYERVARAGDVLLKVHKSNYDIEGFAHEATIADLVRAGKRCDARVVFDLGSGALFDFAGAGIGDEPVAGRIVETGVDAVTMSGDKLLGGVQAGIIVGTRAFVDRLKQNPLRRVLRVDKVAVAALQAVARDYLFARELCAGVPVLSRITARREQLRARAGAVADVLRAAGAGRVGVADDEAVAGGGSFARARVPSAAVVVSCADERAAVRLARALRTRALPVFTRVRGHEVRVNMSTILEHEDAALIDALADVLGHDGGEG